MRLVIRFLKVMDNLTSFIENLINDADPSSLRVRDCRGKVSKRGMTVERYFIDFEAATRNDKGKKRQKKINKHFRYRSKPGSNHPPDAISNWGVEYKKLENFGDINYNSSTPAQVLDSNNEKYNKEAKVAAEECEKSLGYIPPFFHCIANLKEKKVTHAFFVDGKCICHDSNNVLKRAMELGLKILIEQGDEEAKNCTTDTNEIAVWEDKHGNKERARQMRSIPHFLKSLLHKWPSESENENDYKFIFLITKENYLRISNENREKINYLCSSELPHESKLKINSIEIENKKEKLNCTIIEYTRKIKKGIA